jgi:transcriptional regulator with XRE-family HTH domain
MRLPGQSKIESIILCFDIAEATPLAFWRKKRGMTQTALAAAVGISNSYLSGLESGSRKGDPALSLRLARALKVRMEEIVEG